MTQKYDELVAKLKELSDKELDEVNGGGLASTSYQLYYQNNPLPMNTKVVDLCTTYPELRTALGDYYNLVANYTLNYICMFFGGVDTIQGLIDAFEASQN